MTYLTFAVDAPSGTMLGIKEWLAMELESFGDVKLVGMKEVQPEQINLLGGVKRGDV